jgi:hypothetical protein
MTFAEAKTKKNQFKEVNFKDKNGVEYVYMVLPKTPEYLKNYNLSNKLNNYRFFDDDAIRFAKDNLFGVYPVAMHRDKK